MIDLLASPASAFRRRSTLEMVALDAARELGAGGEARVVAVLGDGALVAKLYHEPTVAKARKVALMMADEPALDASAAALAWPRDLLLDGRGQLVGFLMERAAGPRVFELYNPSTRRSAAPGTDHALLHRVGASLAAAFEALHERGYVIGDVNESNVLVRPGGAVTLVDTDSMQVPDRANGTVLRSRVGKAEFTPPELQGRPFGDFDRTPEHDRFGLAVLLFLLLMEGTHPFAGRMADGSEAPPVEERIRRGLFPHGMHRAIHPPRLAPELSLLHPALRSLFVRAFVDGHRDPAARPTAAEWRAVLAAAEAKLETCGRNGFHRFGAHLEACPWCERAERLGGRDPFPASAEPPPAHRTRGSGRGRAARPVPAPALAPAVASAPPAVTTVLGIDVPAWFQPFLGPSGAQHPLAWVVPAAVVLSLAPTGLQILCILALVGAASWWLTERRWERPGLTTAGASALMVALAFLAIAPVGGLSGDSPSRPRGDRFREEMQQASESRPVPPGVAARLGAATTPEKVDAPPELLNRAVAEREIAGLLHETGTPETRGAVMAVIVRADGTVDPSWVAARDGGHQPLATAALRGLSAMRFRPLTRGGVATGAVVWIEMDFER